MEKVHPPLFGELVEDPEIDADRIIKKIEYEGWRKKKNFVEYCFLRPLEDAFKLLRKNMFVLYMQGKSTHILQSLYPYHFPRPVETALG